MSDTKDALAGILGQTQNKAKKKSVSSKKVPEGIAKLNEKSKLVSLRFDREDLEKLTAFCKTEYGIDKTSQIFKKVIYAFMDEKGLV